MAIAVPGVFLLHRDGGKSGLRRPDIRHRRRDDCLISIFSTSRSVPKLPATGSGTARRSAGFPAGDAGSAIRCRNGLVIPPETAEAVPGVSTIAGAIIGSRCGHADTGRFVRRRPQRHGWRGRLPGAGNAVIGGVSGTGCQQGQQTKGYDRAHGRRLHQCLPVCLCAGSLLGGVVRARQTVCSSVPIGGAEGRVDMGIDGGGGLGFVLSPQD